MAQPEELDTLYKQQELVRKMAYEIKHYLYMAPPEPTEGDAKTMSSEKIQQMIDFEMGTANILGDVLQTLPRLGKG